MAIKIEVNGFTWYWQEVNEADGKLDYINLFDKDDCFVCRFADYKEMLHFLNGVIDCGKGAVLIK